jgi:outer membrane protein OmpA-like peptidoglycan-associated protein
MAKLLVASALFLGVAACSSIDDLMDTSATGSLFTQALFKDYRESAQQAANLPPTEATSNDGFFSSLNPFSDNEVSAGDRLSKAFTSKALAAADGNEPEPETTADRQASDIRDRLVRAITSGKEQFPDLAARVQVDFDCWILYGTVSTAAAASQTCRSALDGSLAKLENASRPAPPPTTVATPPPVARVPVPPPPALFTVYFDFDSWTLSAEDLATLTNVINTARAGSQTNITVVGHTDTSGDAGYNQKLSVHRANVVVEALVDMGARRPAIHASGVGETDLAVVTPDGVKEAKNRRAVISPQP